MTSTFDPTNELYSSLSSDIRLELSKLAKATTVAQGSKLVRQGVRPEQLIILNSGLAEITVPVSGKPVSLGTVGSGKVLGLRSIMCGEVPEIDVTCLEECEVTLLPNDVFLEFLRCNPEMYFAVVKVLSAELTTVQSFIREKTSRTKTS